MTSCAIKKWFCDSCFMCFLVRFSSGTCAVRMHMCNIFMLCWPPRFKIHQLNIGKWMQSVPNVYESQLCQLKKSKQLSNTPWLLCVSVLSLVSIYSICMNKKEKENHTHAIITGRIRRYRWGTPFKAQTSHEQLPRTECFSETQFYTHFSLQP